MLLSAVHASSTDDGIVALVTSAGAPTVEKAASAAASPVTGTTTALSVLGADAESGESSLTYTWKVTTLPTAATSPSFSNNATNAAKTTTVTFSQAGDYVFTVTITDPSGLSVTSTVSVTVTQTATSIALTPGVVSCQASSTQQFTAVALDQFGLAMATQPEFTWASNVGTITSSGLWTAPRTSGSGLVTATSGTLTAKSTITVTPASSDATIAAGIVYYENHDQNDAAGDTFQITWTGGATGSQLTRIVLNTDTAGDGLTAGEVFFDTATSGLGTAGARSATVIQSTGITSSTFAVTDGGTTLTIDFTGFDAGETFVFTVDVDTLEASGANLLAEGAGFEGTSFAATFTASGYTTTTGGAAFLDSYDTELTASGLNLPSDDYGASLAAYTAGAILSLPQSALPSSISGTVYNDVDGDSVQDTGEAGISGVTLTLYILQDDAYILTGRTAVTDASGHYTFDALPPGTYRIFETQPSGYYSNTATPGTINGTTHGIASGGSTIYGIELSGNENSIGNDFSESLPARLSGSVYHDANNNGVVDTGEIAIGGVLLTLGITFVNGNTATMTARTNSNGYFEFTDLPSLATYTLTETQPTGFTDGLDSVGTGGGTLADSSDKITGIQLQGGENATDYYFGETISDGTIEWTGAESTSWETPLNWTVVGTTTHRVPTSTDKVRIGAGKTVVCTSAVTVAELINEGTILFSGGKLYVPDGKVVNAPRALIHCIGSEANAFGGAIFADFTNYGTIQVNGREFAVNPDWSGTPWETWYDSTCTFANCGMITVEAHGLLTVGAQWDPTYGAIEGEGQVLLEGATLTLSTDWSPAVSLGMLNSTITGSSTLTIPSGTFVWMANSAITAPVVNAGTILVAMVTRDDIVAGTTTITGDLTISTGGCLLVGCNNTTLLAQFSSSLSTSFQELLDEMTLSQGYLSVVGTVTNNGTIALYHAAGGSSLTVTTGTLVNAAGGTIDSRLAGTPVSDGNLLNATIDNQGLIQAKNGSFTINPAAAYASNTVLNKGNGQITVAANRTLTIGGATVTNQDHAAILAADNAVLTFNVTTLLFDDTSYLAASALSTLALKGSFLGTTTNAAEFSMPGLLAFIGTGTESSPQQLELFQNDLGNVGSGHQSGFAFNQISVASGTHVRLVDLANNSTGTAPEAGYAQAVVCPDLSLWNQNGLPFYIFTNTLPSVEVDTPQGEQSGDILLTYTLFDSQADLCSIAVEYSLDGGTTWKTATAAPGGDGVTGLASESAGIAHTFIWASRTDLVAGKYSNVLLRITPTDTSSGTAGLSQSFTIDNTEAGITIRWTGGDGTSWEDADNWTVVGTSTHRTPTSSDTVYIGAGYTVICSSNVTVNGLTNDGTLIMNGTSGLTLAVVGAAFVNTGVFEYAGANAHGHVNAILTNSGTIHVSHGFLHINLDDDSTSGWSALGTSYSFANTGTIQLDGTDCAIGGLASPAALGTSILGTGMLAVCDVHWDLATGWTVPDAASVLLVLADSTLTLDGALIISEDSALGLLNSTIDGDVTNYGALEAFGSTIDGQLTTEAGSSLAVGVGPLSSIGTLWTATTANLILTHGFTNYGTIELYNFGAGSTLTVQGTLVNATTGTIVTMLGMSAQSGSIAHLNADLDNRGKLLIAECSLAINADNASTSRTLTNSATSTIIVAQAERLVLGGLSITVSDTASILLGADAVLDFAAGTVTIADEGYLVCDSSSIVHVRGSLFITSTNVESFAMPSVLLLDGSGTAASPQLLELLEQDLGDVADGYTESAALVSLQLSAGTYVRLVDRANNSTGTTAEAGYTESLLLAANSTLDLNGLHLYAHAVSGTGTIDDTSLSATLLSDHTQGSVYGEAIIFTVTVAAGQTASSSTDSIQFLVDGVSFGSPVAPLPNSSVNRSLASLGAGTHTVSIVYTRTVATGRTIQREAALTVVVTPATLIVAADNKTKVYGAALPTLTASYTGFVNGDTEASLTAPITLTTTATAASHVTGSPYVISCSGASSPNYTITFVAGSLTVTPAPLTITADNQTMVSGAALPTLTASYNGFVNGDTVADLDTAVTLSTTATASSAAGTYTIVAAGAQDSDYAITFVDGTLTVKATATCQLEASIANSSVYAQPVTFTAGVVLAGSNSTAMGTVMFWDGDTLLATVILVDGVATFTTSSLTTGLHTLHATYSGDSSGDACSSAALSHTIQSAALQVDPLDPSRFQLCIGGSSGRDLILVSYVARTNEFVVRSTGNVPFTNRLSASNVSRVLVFGGAGNDTLRIDSSVLVPAMVFGGDGNDTLSAGTVASVLDGGAGDDALFGGKGRDLLLGGLGTDFLLGKGQDDVLVGGTTDFDSDVVALDRILAEWSRSDVDYGTRVGHLLGPDAGGTAGGSNATYYLNATTVHNDTFADWLSGNSNRDWFFTTTGRRRDRLSGNSTDDVQTVV